MKMRINELAKICGVSIRTLHYYDEIGLLKPSDVDNQNGYRFYDESSLERMQEILFYRELDFTLKSIGEILSSPKYDKQDAIAKQKHLLMLKKKRLERLIKMLEIVENGGYTMSLKEFDNTEYETARRLYEKEAKEQWGDTASYKEFSKKAFDYSNDKWNSLNSEMDVLIAEFAQCRKTGNKPESAKAQEIVKRWQDFISSNYYNCTKEILSELGKMYIDDEHFKSNIDKHGAGTAEFMSEAISIFC